jgi:predicted nucleic acid-binding protein
VKTSETLLLDTGILGRLCHPRIEQHRPFTAWLTRQLERSGEVSVVLPEICDYELRRKLLHLSRRNPRFRDGLTRLDRLGEQLTYLPISTAAMRIAAALWAEARGAGRPTAPDAALDADVILAAQARTVEGVVVTMNAEHLSRFVAVRDWARVQPAEP